jgi:hypothetical protein
LNLIYKERAKKKKKFRNNNKNKMSNIKAINNSSNNNLYKLQDNSTGFLSNAFPIRRFVKSSFDR